MTCTIIDAPQRSAEWFQARCGRLTASCAHAMLSQIKSGESAGRRDLRTKLVLERITKQPQDDGYVNLDMQRGIDLEADAFAAYEAATGVLVSRVGFLQHPSLLVGCSPDGFLDGGRGGLELKVPRSANHLKYLRSGGVLPPEHVGQILHSLWVTGAEYWDFASYDDRFPPALQLFRVRVPRNEVEIVAYARCALAFLAEVEAEYQDVLKLVERAA
jgi:hypothetical protein